MNPADNWPPFEYLENGEFAGFEVDILEEVMGRLSEEEGVTKVSRLLA